MCIYYKNFSSRNLATCFGRAAIIRHVFTKICEGMQNSTERYVSRTDIVMRYAAVEM